MRSIILGFDAFDPDIFESLSNENKLPNLTSFFERDGYARFSVTNPPQSEVSWTSIATGLDPSYHGIFDFVHRDPSSYKPYVSLLPTKKTLGGVQFARPFSAVTIFDKAIQAGYSATSLWWPATFPAKLDSPVNTIPGLGTPDIQGKLGVGALYTIEPDAYQTNKTPVFRLQESKIPEYSQTLKGPAKKSGANSSSNLEIPFTIRKTSNETYLLKVNRNVYKLTPGKWSPIIEIKIKAGLFINIYAITRAIVTNTKPLTVYFLPLQIHPIHPIWPYGKPKSMLKSIWSKTHGFLSLGWPQDTTGLEDNCISDEQFLSLCNDVFQSRATAFLSRLDRFEEGILACVFDSLDRIQHMFLKDYPEIVEDWYIKLDNLAGEVLKKLNTKFNQKYRLIIVSDHGFSRFDYKVHVNQWLYEKGYLQTKTGASTGFANIDWHNTKAYAIGLNSIYINQAGRERDGIVPPSEKKKLLATLINELEFLKGPDNQRIFSNIYHNTDIFAGPLSEYGPDLILGYNRGYRASQETGLGNWNSNTIEPNQDHWNADHCIDPSLVPGVIFSSQGLQDFTHPSYRDFPAIAIDSEPDTSSSSTPPSYKIDEDEEALEERLKSLGYL